MASFTLSLEPVLGMITPYSLHIILALQEIIQKNQDEQAFHSLKKLVKQFTMGFTSVIQGFWQFSQAVLSSPHYTQYQAEIKKLFVLANVRMSV